MNNIEAYNINLESVGTEQQSFHYVLDSEFFRTIENSNVDSGEVETDVAIARQGRDFKIDVSLSGFVTVTCDLCLEPMEQPIKAQATLMATLGEEFNDDGDIITIDERDGNIDLSWLLYEQVALAIPLRHVHEQGLCDPKMVSVINSIEHKQDNQTEQNKLTDERWNELEKLKTILKD